MNRKIHKPLVLGDDGPAPPRAAEPEPVPVKMVDAEPDRDLDMTMFEPEQAPEPKAEPEPETMPKSAGLSPAPDKGSPPAHAVEVRPEPLSLFMPPRPQVKGGRAAYIVAGVVTVIWAAIPAAFFLGFAKGVQPFTYEPFAIALLIAWAIGSIGILWIAARMLGQSLRLGAEVRYARSTAETMLTPAALAAVGTGSVMQTVRRDIDAAVAAAAQARHELTTLREVLAAETAKLTDAAHLSARSAADLTGVIGAERQELGMLSTALGRQVAEVEDVITRQARMVAEASDLAETQIREAEATLTARAADLAAAAGEASDAARTAGEDLSRQTARLEAAGAGVGDQIRTVEQGLAEQRAALVSVSVSLRAEQEDFAAQVESQQAQLTEVLAQARAASQDVETAANASSDALRELITDAADQYRQVADATAEERDLFGAQTLQSIGALSEAARNERQLLQEETEAAIQAMVDAADRAQTHAEAQTEASIQALTEAAGRAQAETEAQAEAARQRIDLLGEAAFAAGQKADQVFDARLNDARALIEQSAELIEEAGQRTQQRLAESLAAAKGTLDQLESLLQEVDIRTANLPDHARTRGEEVKAAVEAGVEELLVAARRAADETQAIDAAFQERVRRNYEMLSEAVRMMGVVGGSAASTRPARSVLPPRATVAPARPATPPPPPKPEPSSEDLGLRPRLRFSAPVEAEPEPHEPSPEPDELFEPQASVEPEAAEPAADDGDWTFNDILSDLEEAPTVPRAYRAVTPPTPPVVAAPATGTDAVLAEIKDLGIDPGALLPSGRTDEIAGILRAGDSHGARRVVRRLAPAAMRRLSRRVMMEPALRAQVAQFIESFSTRIDDAADADHTGETLAQLVGSEEGRGYLLFDAALGEGA